MEGEWIYIFYFNLGLIRIVKNSEMTVLPLPRLAKCTAFDAAPCPFSFLAIRWFTVIPTGAS